MRFPNRVGEGAIPHPDAGDRDHDRCGHDQKEDQPKSEQSQLAHGHLSASARLCRAAVRSPQPQSGVSVPWGRRRPRKNNAGRAPGQRFNASHRGTVITRGRDVGLAVRRGQTAARRAAPAGEPAGAAEMEATINLKKIAGTATIAGVLGAAALGLGPASAQADPDWVNPNIPWIPGWADWAPDWDPGVNWGSPGQIKNAWCPWNPPGHWKGGPHGIPCS